MARSELCLDELFFKSPRGGSIYLGNSGLATVKRDNFRIIPLFSGVKFVAYNQWTRFNGRDSNISTKVEGFYKGETLDERGVRIIYIQIIPKDIGLRHVLSQILRIEGYKGDIHFREFSRNQSSHRLF